MASLYKRANPAQVKILRIIEGAVLNTADAHGLKRDNSLARSIAKRAAGTLSSQWPEVLAAKSTPSEMGAVRVSNCGAHEAGTNLGEVQPRSGASQSQRGPRRVASQIRRRHPLTVLWGKLSAEMRYLKDDPIQYQANIKLLRMIDKLRKELGV